MTSAYHRVLNRKKLCLACKTPLNTRHSALTASIAAIFWSDGEVWNAMCSDRLSLHASGVARLLDYIRNDEIDPTFLITHRMPLEKAADMYRIFQDKEDECIKVVLTP